jgi:large subunit ribosomal protein L29
MSKTKELRGMPKEELEKRLDELRKDLLKDNSQIATGTAPKNPGNLKKNKKSIARILTIINEKNKEVKKKDE